MSKVFESYQLHAYVDGQLSREECLEIEHEMQLQPDLEQEVCHLRALKGQVKEMYQDIPVPTPGNKSVKPKRVWSIPKAMAASLLFGIVLGAGSLHWYASGLNSTSFMQENMLAQQSSGRYLIHLDSADQSKQMEALQRVSEIFADGGPDVQIDVISNHQGVTLFDVNNPNRMELESLLNRYDNLTLYACKRALERAWNKGEKIQMLPQVKHELPAIDTVAKRLTEGWKYIKI